MSAHYLKYDIERLVSQREGMFLVPEDFKKTTRLELKWAYVALLNLLLDEPKYNEQGEAYLEEDFTSMAKPLAELMNKKVDEAKVQKYIHELVDTDMLDIDERRYYLEELSKR